MDGAFDFVGGLARPLAALVNRRGLRNTCRSFAFDRERRTELDLE